MTQRRVEEVAQYKVRPDSTRLIQ